MIKDEWKRLLKNPILLVVLIVIMSIPAMYSGLFLASMWDPYGDLEKLPVAVVNLDESVIYNDKELHIGNDLVDNLKEDMSLDFHFTNEKEAREGLEAGNYYMVITIPSDFSYKASTATDYNPEQLELLYDTNPATNYVATKLSQSAITKIEASLQESVTETYIDALVDSINDIGNDLKTASDGASDILDGETKLQDGISELSDGAKDLSKGASDLSNGTKDLYSGSTKLNNGAKELNSGATKLNTGIKNYLNGTTAINNGIVTLHDNFPTLVNGIGNLNEAAPKLVTGNKKIVAGFEGDNGAVKGIEALSDGASKLDTLIQNADKTPVIKLDQKTLDGIAVQASKQTSNQIEVDNQIVLLCAAGLKAQYLANGASLSDEKAIEMALTYVRTLSSEVASKTATSTATSVVAGINAKLPTTLGVYTSQLSTGAGSLKEGINKLHTGSTEVQTGLEQIAAGISTLNTGAGNINTGIDTLYKGSKTLISNNKTLTDGAAALETGSKNLQSGTNDLESGAKELNSGAKKLSDGAVDLKDGINTVNDKLPELSDGTKALQNGLKNGADTITDKNLSSTNAKMMADPVKTTETQITTVANNGTAMAAYMMSVGLWVACLAFCLMYPLTEHNNLKNGFAWWASKASVLFPIAVIQGISLVLILQKALGLTPANLGNTILVSVLSSLAFMSIMYFFNALIGKVGSFLMLVFMVFQLAGSAGTYPIELSGPLALALHRFVPFTYTVNAFRSTIGGGTNISASIEILVAIIIVFSVATLVLFQTRSLKEKHGKENVHDWLDAKGLA